jgi:hypothetical protein
MERARVLRTCGEQTVKRKLEEIRDDPSRGLGVNERVFSGGYGG